MRISIRWLGNAGFEFRFGQLTLLVDPFLTRPLQQNVYFGRVAPDIDAIHEHIHECDHILVSHAHFDHFMDAPEIARQTGAVIHGSPNTCEMAKAQGVPAEQIHLIQIDDTFFLDDFKVHILPAAHPWIPGYTRRKLNGHEANPMRLRDYCMDGCFSFLIIYQGRRLLVWSSISTERSVPADLLICRAVSGKRWYQRMMENVQPKVVIPSHWDDMFVSLSEPVKPFYSPPRLAWPPLERIDLKEFERNLLKAWPGCRVMMPERFRVFEIEV
jgi:L-ascorbate metabolism protein UlaG (beta-lactamase superfamily)